MEGMRRWTQDPANQQALQSALTTGGTLATNLIGAGGGIANATQQVGSTLVVCSESQLYPGRFSLTDCLYCVAKVATGSLAVMAGAKVVESGVSAVTSDQAAVRQFQADTRAVKVESDRMANDERRRAARVTHIADEVSTVIPKVREFWEDVKDQQDALPGRTTLALLLILFDEQVTPLISWETTHHAAARPSRPALEDFVRQHIRPEAVELPNIKFWSLSHPVAAAQMGLDLLEAAIANLLEEEAMLDPEAPLPEVTA